MNFVEWGLQFTLRETTTIPAMGAWRQLCKPNPSRWHLVIINNLGIGCRISIDPEVPIDQGIVLDATDNLFRSKFQDDPVLTTSSWYVSFSAVPVGVTVVVWETTLTGT